MSLRLPLDLDEQHPSAEQRREDREDHTRQLASRGPRYPIPTRRPRCQEWQMATCFNTTPHQVPTQVGLQRLPVPQMEQLESYKPPPGDETEQEHLHLELCRTLRAARAQGARWSTRLPTVSKPLRRDPASRSSVRALKTS